jgi:ATP-dependent HslUV protease ATP-binding subunit HslU
VIERLLEEVSFAASDRPGTRMVIDAKYVREQVGALVKDTDLSKFIL